MNHQSECLIVCTQGFHLLIVISTPEEHRLEGNVVDLSNAFRYLTIDISAEYAVPRSRLTLDSPNLAGSYNGVSKDLANIATKASSFTHHLFCLQWY